MCVLILLAPCVCLPCRHHKEQVMACAWLPDSQRFLTGSVDKSILILDTAGRELHRLKRAKYMNDLAVSHNGTTLFIASNDTTVHIVRCDLTLHRIQ
jgi:WD40 repeat protein